MVLLKIHKNNAKVLVKHNVLQDRPVMDVNVLHKNPASVEQTMERPTMHLLTMEHHWMRLLQTSVLLDRP
jgi:hypothetical protein